MEMPTDVYSRRQEMTGINRMTGTVIRGKNVPHPVMGTGKSAGGADEK
jgi:hypothetical protein